MLNFLGLGKNTININKDNIIKEGTLLKESRILKNWKSYVLNFNLKLLLINVYLFRRWTVLTDTNILTFEKERNYSNPTEVIDIINIKTVKSDENPMSFKFVSL